MKKNRKNTRAKIIIILAMLLSAGVITTKLIQNNQQKKKAQAEAKVKAREEEKRVTDSLCVYYGDLLRELEQQKDSLNAITGQRDTITGRDGDQQIVIGGQMKQISDIIYKLYRQSCRVDDDMDAIFDDYDYQILVPGLFELYDPELTSLQRINDERHGIERHDYSDWWKEDMMSDSPSWYLYMVWRYSIPSMVATGNLYSDAGTMLCKPNASLEYKIRVLESVQEWLSHVDNSRHVYDDATLQELGNAVSKHLQTLYAQRSAQEQYDRCRAELSQQRARQYELKY